MTTLALRSIPLGSTITRPLPLNWWRISALSGSFSAHLAIVLLLLVPPVAMEINRVARHDEKSIVITLPEEKISKEIPLPEPAHVIKTKIAVSHPKPVITMERPTPVAPEGTAPPMDNRIANDAGDHAPAGTSNGSADIGGDAAPQAMGYGNVTRIPYPIIALRNREQGTVMLRVLVGADGKAQAVEIDRSSGSHALDVAARDAVRHWTFKPGMRAGVPYAAWAIVPVSFALPQ